MERRVGSVVTAVLKAAPCMLETRSDTVEVTRHRDVTGLKVLTRRLVVVTEVFRILQPCAPGAASSPSGWSYQATNGSAATVSITALPPAPGSFSRKAKLLSWLLFTWLPVWVRPRYGCKCYSLRHTRSNLQTRTSATIKQQNRRRWTPRAAAHAQAYT